ncbi:MAG: glycoside hydrolase family 5 protein [Dokdonella sp.]|uniref:glycoside hydrolase family 5 protein n=1 Tax=Dokdonella sp. TaxID=2291710 RepID=UPI003264B297
MNLPAIRIQVTLASLIALCGMTTALANTTFGGVNLSSAEFGNAIPGTPNVDYTWPTNAELDYFRSRGMNVVRVAFKWERMQAALNAPLEANYLASLDAVVAHASTIGLHVILDPHNYARYRGNVVGTPDVPDSALADFWSRLSAHFVGNDALIFGLMNEPHGMPTEQWAQAANAAIVAIRSTGAQQLILVPGNAWTGAHSWSSNWYGTPNATAMLAITDSGSRFAFELHQYFDSDSSGTSSTCSSAAGTGANQSQGVTTWMRTHGYRGFLGEFASADNGDCSAAVNSAMNHLRANADVWLGWTWWAAGPWWGDYIFTLEPTSGFSVDRPQMSWLMPYMPPLFANGFDD